MSGNEELAYEIVLECPYPLTRSQLQVDFGSTYDRVAHPIADLERGIEKVWEERLRANPRLFNASKFRYGGCKLLPAADPSKRTCVCLCLGLTDYKSFMGTNLSPNWESFLVSSKDDVERCKHTASPLGNGAIVETEDGGILVLLRSEHVGEFPGHLVFPGGHSEPQEIGIENHSVSSDARLLNEKISEEMFDGIIREVVEETGAPAASLSDPLFIGISRRAQNVRPTAFFFVKCSLTAHKVLQYYEHAQHKFESSQLLSISKDCLPPAAEKMPGCHQGGAVLYKLMNDSKGRN